MGIGAPVPSCAGKLIVPSMYPDNPFDPRSCIMLVVHDSRFSLLNFCSSERIVSEGDDDIDIGVGCYVSQCICCV
jgi:hypothetical protein